MTDLPLRITLPMEPVAASRPRTSRYGTYYQKPYRTFKSLAPAAIRSQLPEGWEAHPGPLAVWVNFVMTRPSKPKYFYPSRGDGDNLEKAIYDACNDLVWVDDAHVVTAQWSKMFAKDGEEGYIDLYIDEIDEAGLEELREGWNE